MPNYKSFDDVLKELEMDEDELKRLVSEGQIRAFRDDDRMKFRSEDVHALARQRTTAGGGLDLGETQLGGEGLEIIEEETDETLLDLGNLTSDADFEDTGATSVPTVELSDLGDDKDATLTEELVFDETDELSGLDFGNDDADATQKIEGGLDLSDDDELGLQTEPIEGGELDELDDLDEGGAEEGSYQYAAAPPGAPGPIQIQEQVRYVEIVPNESVVWKVLTGVTFILVMLLLATPPAMGMFSGQDPALGTFWGSTAHSFYLKGPNANTHVAQHAYEKRDQVPFAVGNQPGHVVWPGMPIVRNMDGFEPGSGSAGASGE